MANCWPWFHAPYTALAAEGWPNKIVPSGCGKAGPDGNVPCSPESMRAKSEAWLASNHPDVLAQIGGTLTLELYTYARYMHSEMGNGTVEERVAVGEALRNRSKMGRTIYQLLTPSGFYGPIHASDSWCAEHGYDCTGKRPNTCCAPYKRWAATSREPSVMTIMLAHLVVSGQSNDFTGGADDQAAVNTTSWVKYLGKQREYWVGPLAGVDHRKTFLVRKVDTVTNAVAGKALLERGMAAIGQPPVWPPASDVCRKQSGVTAVLTSRTAQSFLLASLGLAFGAGAAAFIARRYVHPA